MCRVGASNSAGQVAQNVCHQADRNRSTETRLQVHYRGLPPGGSQQRPLAQRDCQIGGVSVSAAGGGATRRAVACAQPPLLTAPGPLHTTGMRDRSRSSNTP